MNKYYNELFLGKPIFYQNLIFYPVTIDEITNITDLETFRTLMFPFMITTEYLISEKIILEKDYKNFNIFEDYIVKDNDSLQKIAFILEIFCRTSKISTLNNKILLYNSENMFFEITKDNFEDISDILRKLVCVKKIKAETPPPNMSQRQKDIWEKLQAGRKRESSRNEIHIYDIMNMCSYCGNYYISSSELKKMTIWQLINCYNSKTNIKSYDDNLMIGLASKDLKPILNNNHWSKKLLIRD